MASRFLVGTGARSWTNVNTAIWAATSGGATGASVPTSGDEVTIDANSGTGTVMLTSTRPCSTFTSTNGAVTIDLNSNTLQANGAVVIGSGMAFANTGGGASGQLTMNASGNLTSNGVTLPRLNVASGTTTLQGNLIVSGLISVSGTLNVNGQTCTCSIIDLGGFNLTLGAGTLVLTGTGVVYDSNGGGTISASSGTIKITDTSVSTKTFEGQGKTFGTLWFAGASVGSFCINGSNTFAELKVDAVANTLTIEAGSTQTVTTPTLGGGSPAAKLTIQSSSGGSPFTLSKAGGTVTLDYLNLSDCTASGGATWRARNSTDGGGNSGWTFLNATPAPPRVATLTYLRM